MVPPEETGVADALVGPIKISVRRLDFALRAAGMTQRDLATAACLSTGHISRIMKGTAGVSADAMGAILAAFGNRLTFDELREMQQAPSGKPDGAC